MCFWYVLTAIETEYLKSLINLIININILPYEYLQLNYNKGISYRVVLLLFVIITTKQKKEHQNQSIHS